MTEQNGAARHRARPTLSDIARALGVSEATVSRALRGNPEISEQTRTLIRGVARDLGYVPNAAARSLVRKSSKTLGLLVPDVTDPQHALIVAGFSRASISASTACVCAQSAGQTASPETSRIASNSMRSTVSPFERQGSSLTSANTGCRGPPHAAPMSQS